jgi:hypothetical protein
MLGVMMPQIHNNWRSEMNSIRKCILHLVSLVPLICFGQSDFDQPTNHWKVGDKWKIDVTLYDLSWARTYSDPEMEARKNDETVLCQYVVNVEVTARVSYEGVDCWQLDYSPGEKTPKGYNEMKFRIWVSIEDGSMKGLSQLKGLRDLGDGIIDFDGISFLEDAPLGFPLEMIQWRRGQKQEKPQPSRHKTSAEFKEAASDTSKEVTLAVKRDSVELSFVRQKWEKGIFWWTEYERYIQGHKELYAKLRKP